jgi:hypothetical protein
MKSNIIGNHEMDDLIFQTKSYMFREKTQVFVKITKWYHFQTIRYILQKF